MMAKRNFSGFGNNDKLFFIAGPSVIENKEWPVEIAKKISDIAIKNEIDFIFKAACKRINSAYKNDFSGIGNENALKLLRSISQKFKVPVQTDVYSQIDAVVAAKYVDVIQIPAFLVRDTELLIQAAKTGKTVNIRKGLSSKALDMHNTVNKIRSSNHNKILLTERGLLLGYEDSILDIRSLSTLRQINTPLILDVSCLAGKPESLSRDQILDQAMSLIKAAIANGISGLSFDIHIKPDLAQKTESYYFTPEELEILLTQSIKFKALVNENK